MKKSLWLIGFRAAGKSTMGAQLAREWNLPFLDLDQELERRLGVSILEFVDARGVEEFRREEEKLLREAAARAVGQVIATGGGFVDWEPSRKIVEASLWPKAYLEVSAETLWARLEKQEYRRKIGDLSTRAKMENLLEKRRPFYEKIASVRLASQDISECLAALKSLGVGT